MEKKMSRGRIGAIIAGVIVAVSAVLAGIALAVYFTWPKDNSTEPKLVGNFTILQKTVSQVSNSSICSYLTRAVSNSYLSTPSCVILDKRPGSVKVRYMLIFDEVDGKDAQTVLKLASTAIAEESSNNSTFIIDQNSITFEDQSGAVQNFCDSSSCSGPNVICISVVGATNCVCSTGYTRYNGACVTQRYCKATGTSIPIAQICDKFQDCPDDSDEINCACNSTYQYACRNGRCIYRDWLCDGVADCPQGDDETSPQCAECGSSQFRCEKPRTCISSSVQCDGQPDCSDSSDENQCFSFNGTVQASATGLLSVIYQGVSGYRICSDKWNATWSDRICSIMGLGAATANSSAFSTESFLILDPTISSTNILELLSPGTCSSQLAVAVSCGVAECGTRAVSSASIGPYILNGQRAARGAWPWQVVVYTGYFSGGQFNPILICGGILVSNRWILTAAHCTQITDYYAGIGYIGQTRPANIQILLGTISLKSDPDMVTAYPDRVYTHPSYDADAITNDVGLIRLSSPISFTDTIRPICLPAPDQDLNRFRVCVNTGFGTTLRNTISNDLLQAKMNIMSDSECSKNNPFYNMANQICIGTTPTVGDINICSGDSGGPLACQDSNGVWTVIGVNSYGVGRPVSNAPAEDRCQLSVVARVPALVGWIETTMATNNI